jgi:hypothetical protein
MINYKRMLKDAATAELEVLSHYVQAGTQEHYKNSSQDGWCPAAIRILNLPNKKQKDVWRLAEVIIKLL